MTRYSISQPVTQVEAPRLLTGQGRFTDDVELPRQTHAYFLRSPHAHAEIKGIDTRAAAQMPGVHAVLTAADYKADGLGQIIGPSPMKRRDGKPTYRPPRPALIGDRVRHVGQIVAMVVADSIDQAKDAVERIEVDYEVLPIHLDTATANKPGANQLWPDLPNNEPLYIETGKAADVDAAFAKAARVVNGSFRVSRAAASTMEPRAIAASYDRRHDHTTIYASHQRPYVWRSLLAEELFHIPEHKITLIAGDVGGSYGMKGGLYAEVVLVTWATRKIGRPVKWVCERSEAYVADDQGRDMAVEAEIALDADGKFLAVRTTSNNNIGAYVTWLGFNSTLGIARNLVGTYATPAINGRAASVLTNTVPVSNYRAPGGAPGVFVLERIVDMAAHEMGIDPAEIRRRNFIPAAAMPYRLPGGGTYDCGEFDKVMEKCLALADYANVPKRRADAKARGKILGVGVSSSVDPSAGPSPETAELRFDPGGTLTILVGSTAGGQSHETIYTQIVSDRLGLDIETMTVVEGDTSQLSWGTGTGAARTATIGGTAVYQAVDKVIAKAKRIAAHMLEAAAGDIEFADGVFRVAGTDKSVKLADVAKAAFKPEKLPPDIEIGLYETATWSPDVQNIPNSAHVCEVEIDPETGKVEIVRYTEVHDVGVELNPKLVEGQVRGGIAQAAGQALMEKVVYDDRGQILSGSFMDYAMPRAEDFTAFVCGSHPVPTKTNPLGVKGAGECGTVGGLAAVMNAVNDALFAFGIKHLDMPCTPEKVWRALQGA
jgi:aerobic carbon-monoxide dehydrogenase large subunit